MAFYSQFGELHFGRELRPKYPCPDNVGNYASATSRLCRYSKGAGAKGSKAGNIIEDLVTRELTKLAAETTNHDRRFPRGWIVENYGIDGNIGASHTNRWPPYLCAPYRYPSH